jgi:hypothetical protein
MCSGAMARLMEGGQFCDRTPLPPSKTRNTSWYGPWRVVEQGRHQELLDRGGFYNRLYQSQFTRAEDEEIVTPNPA